jgi:hypothetical protein
MSTRDRVLRPDLDPSREQARFEEERVAMVLAPFGLAAAKWELLDAHLVETGTRRLTFAGFRQRFPTFPVVLAAHYVGGVGHRVDPADLFRRPDRLFLTDLYLEAYTRLADDACDRPVGLVLPFDGYRGGIALHNGDFDTRGVRLTYPVPGDVPPYRVTAEPFDRLLEYLAGGGWSPDEPTVDARPTTRPEPTGVQAAVGPWVSGRLGTGPGFALYVWLTGLLDSASPRHRAFVRRGKDGGRYLAVTHEELAGLTGLTPDAVKRGLRHLKVEGLVRTWRRDRRTLLVLDPPDEATL